jgi:acyl carrier protein
MTPRVFLQLWFVGGPNFGLSAEHPEPTEHSDDLSPRARGGEKDMAIVTRMTEEHILQDVVSILEDMTADWDRDGEAGIGPATRLIADLEFESIDVVQFVVALEEHFDRRDLPFERLLMEDGRYVDEIQVQAVVRFLEEHPRGEGN